MLYSFLALILLAQPVEAASAPAPAATQPAVTVVTTQPVSVVQNIENAAPVEKESLGQVFGETRVGQMFQGRKQVTLQELRDPDFWIDTIRDLVVAVLGFIPRFVVALLFLVFFWMLYRAARRVVIGSMSRAAVDPSIRDMLNHLLKWAIMGFGLVVAGNQIGVQIAALLTAAGIIGLAVGFAAQETLANFIAGIVIFWDKPFKVGDWLEMGDGTYGQVQRVTFRSTRILDLNGQMIIYPNTHMLSNRVANHTTYPLTRVSVPIGIAYKEDIENARRVMLSTTHDDERVQKDPPAEVVVSGCGASSVDLLLRFWIDDASLDKVTVFEYIEKCKYALDAANIQIPYPHMQVLVEETQAIDKLAGGPLRKAG